jgi:hypothetical protein
VTKASENQFPKVTFAESAAPGTPTSGLGWLYEKTDGLIYFTNDGGTEYDLTGSSGSLSLPVFDEGVNKGTATAGINLVGTYAAGTVTGGTAIFTFTLPPGHEFDYVEKTSSTSITATSEATADTVVTGSAVTYDGSTAVMVEFFSPSVRPATDAVADRSVNVTLYDGAASIGIWGQTITPAQNDDNKPFHLVRRLTPSGAAHTYSVRAYVSGGTGTISGGTGGVTAAMPAFIRITKV